MKSEKGQSLVMVGVALFLLAGLCLYLGLSQPKISSGVLVETPSDSGAVRYHDAVGCRHRWSIRCKHNGNGCTNHRFRQRGHSQLPGEPEHGYF